MGPREFFDTVVRPNLYDVESDYGDLRRAFNAAASVDALAAQIFDALRNAGASAVHGLKDDTEYREALAVRNSHFAQARDLAKALKHVTLDRGNPIIRSAHDVEVRSLGWGDAAWDEGRWDSPPQVVMKVGSADWRVVEAVLKNSAEFLDVEMKTHGL